MTPLQQRQRNSDASKLARLIQAIDELITLDRIGGRPVALTSREWMALLSLANKIKPPEVPF